ncbi:uncharacterized protein [Dysidea avara]|uniref:uncharacterized protein n=1 Tax=Dysidea avara TaxID=196820 RepID=UPI00332FFB8D
MPGLKYFFDAFSQPSRAVMIMLRANKIPYEPVIVNIAKLENRSNEEFMKVCPAKTVPAIDDNGFKLFESAAIMRYLVSKYNLPDHWYPANPERRAKVDEYLDWHHTNTRAGAAMYFANQMIPRFTGGEIDMSKVEEAWKKLHKSIKLIEGHFLANTNYLAGDEISIADVQAVCEFTQLWMPDYKVYEAGSRIDTWTNDCKERLQPYFDEAHKMVYFGIKSGLFKSKL